MTPEIDREYSKILDKIAEKLDLTDTQYEIATRSYQAVASWLDAPDSPLMPYRPHISPQGSFRYGTVIRPLLEDEEYDVDLTCKLHISESQVTQQWLKKVVGDRLKAKETYKRMLAPEKRRCWRLQYNDQFRFHLDIVPSIPDSAQYIQQLTTLLAVPSSLAIHALCITDNETWDTDVDFPKSNPEGYALWFLQCMRVEFDRRRMLLAEQMKMSVDAVPEYQVKTPLQRVVQLLKRHRDLRYGDNPNAPISIIITTLAAKAYQNETDIFVALRNVLSRMASFIELDEQGNKVVKNPVNPLENFADKWAENPEKEELFFEWLNRAKRDFDQLAQKRGLPELAVPLQQYFGENIAKKALNEVAEQTLKEREANRLFMAAGTGILSSQQTPKSVPVTQHNPYGSDKG